jgi:DNA modification methylase
MNDTYADFLSRKTLVAPSAGKDVDPEAISPVLFPFQRAIVRWAARKGRAALFENTGLGKTLQYFEWSRLVPERALIIAPLAVAKQAVSMSAMVSLPLVYARNMAEATRYTITNYERVENFDPTRFDGVVLDESSILKGGISSATYKTLREMFHATPYKLCATATPAPNGYEEIANHAEFLGVMSRAEVMATFFINDENAAGSKGWRLKKHAANGPFWQWLSSWAMSVRHPRDIGFDQVDYDLPPLTVNHHIVDSGYVPEGRLFFDQLQGVSEYSRVRKGTIPMRVADVARIVTAEPDEQWLIWCERNDEAVALLKALPGAVNVEGKQDAEAKADALYAFAEGRTRIMITKPGIAGMGLNFQSCSRMLFCGLSFSWEDYYQAIRRCYRFGQARPVEVGVVISDAEVPVLRTIERKEAEATAMAEQMAHYTAQYARTELGSGRKGFMYQTKEETGDGWRLLLGDSVERLSEIETNSIGLSVFSPPFSSLYTYSASERDLGNTRNLKEFLTHFRFIVRELRRVMMPGRSVCVHIQDLQATYNTHGYRGLIDFSGPVKRLFQREGFTLWSVITIDKNPQIQAVRNKVHELMMVTKERDAIQIRPTLPDYLLVFHAPGDNLVPIHDPISDDQWIKWASPIWYGIRETAVLNVAAAKDNADERHMCPLQLPVIERATQLWSLPGETVLDPFNGIASTGTVAIKMGRQYVGIELKHSYFETSIKNLRLAELEAGQLNLFDVA